MDSFTYSTGISLPPEKEHKLEVQKLRVSHLFKKKEVIISYKYEDIFDRVHTTSNIIFKIETGDRFVPHHLNWKFKKAV
jgi:hypothetical protein